MVLHGGISPAPRRGALAALRLGEREEISRGIAVGRSLRQIAQGLGRAPSTVSREIRRNGGSQTYRANRADWCAWDRALRPKPCRLALHRELRWRVAQKLALQWSPEQISGWPKQEFPTHQDMQISHEAIYRSLFIQTRGVLKKELTAQLRTARRMRRPKSHNANSGQGHILDMVSIRERPAEIEDRAVPGHWEGDLLTGANDTHIAIHRNFLVSGLCAMTKTRSQELSERFTEQWQRCRDWLFGIIRFRFVQEGSLLYVDLGSTHTKPTFNAAILLVKTVSYAICLITDHFCVAVHPMRTMCNRLKAIDNSGIERFGNEVSPSEQLARDLLTVTRHQAAPIDRVL